MDEHSSRNPLTPTPVNPGNGALTLPDVVTRHDGWSGECMATFCEVLAETGIVTDACLAASKNRAGAYMLRQRDPLFAAAWDAALGFARAKLAAALLERSLEGSVERFYREGRLVAEKRFFDDRLGLAVLKRLDKQADCAIEQQALPAVLGGEWETALAALRSGGSAELAALLAEASKEPALSLSKEPALSLSKGDEIDKVDTPPESFFCAGETDAKSAEHPAPRMWSNGFGDWHTDFPPPADFDGRQVGFWGDVDYERECSDAELAALRRSSQLLDPAERLAAAEAERDQWFAELEAQPEDDNAEQEDEAAPPSNEPVSESDAEDEQEAASPTQASTKRRRGSAAPRGGGASKRRRREQRVPPPDLAPEAP